MNVMLGGGPQTPNEEHVSLCPGCRGKMARLCPDCPPTLLPLQRQSPAKNEPRLWSLELSSGTFEVQAGNGSAMRDPRSMKLEPYDASPRSRCSGSCRVREAEALHADEEVVRLISCHSTIYYSKLQL